MIDMDVSKGETSCSPNAKLNFDTSKKFTEQISDSASSQCDIVKFSNNNNVSPSGEESSISLPKVGICTKDTVIGNAANSNKTLDSSKKAVAKQTDGKSKNIKDFGLYSSKETKTVKETPISKIGLQSLRKPDLLDTNNVNGENNNALSCALSKERSAVNLRTENENCTVSGIVTSKQETGTIGSFDKSVCPLKKADTDITLTTLKAPSNIVSVNEHTAKQNPADDGAITQNTTNAINSNEYMPQNHVFVFSTQLANKGADAVLCGQFPTIIDYHRTQPTTILFLEEFLKNPSKTTKLQRQYSLNIMNPMQSVGQPQYWSKEGNNLNRIQRQTLRLPLRNVGLISVSKDNTSWNSVSVLDNQISPNIDPLQTFKNSDHESKVNEKPNVTSLQGVKVPDENLTPQQRQHREEQLAKLKKMNKFLFPEKEDQEFRGPHSLSFSSSNSMSTDAEKKSARICSEPLTNNMQNMADNTLKSDQQNVKEIPSIAMTESILQKNSLNVFANELRNIKSYNIPNQSDGQAVETLSSESYFALNTNSLSQNERTNFSSWQKLQSNSFPVEFSCESQEKGTSQSALLPSPLASQQNQPDTQAVLPNLQPRLNNHNNNGPPPPYEQSPLSTSITPMSPANTSSNKISTESTHTSPNTSNVDDSNSTMANYRVKSNGGPNIIPQVNTNNNLMVEISGQKPNMDNLYNFKSTPGTVNNSFAMGFSTPHNMRQKFHRFPPHIGRRMDNIPLNPNLVRMGQNNNSMNFDPISSLTQMSQQLTGVGLGARGGGTNATMNINQTEKISTEQSKLLPNSNCSGKAGGFASSPGRAARHFPPETNGVMCNDRGTLIRNNMCQPNMSFNFGPNSAITGVGLRESIMGREKFDSFTSNVHVRASAPNTIQYMPARAQNVNNIRMPQNLEMFQAYSNDQAMNNNVGHSLGETMNNSAITSMNPLNTFGNSNREFQQNDLGVSSSVISNNDFMNLPP